MASNSNTILESWAGLECTVNRIGETFWDQFAYDGAPTYAQFIAECSDLRLDALRYNVSWERLTSDVSGWEQVTRDLGAMRDHAIRPIIGLVHHGSGPPTTNLLSPCFAKGLAAHARDTVERFSWVNEWTPVNEPLTTARFAALYGIWYPHARDEQSFWLALLNQIDATRLSMREIRTINPAAILVQTEDLGRTYATASLCSQSGFDNTRRWMTWDLLEGRVDASHPLWNRMVALGFGDRLRAIADDPCPANVIGVNHYLTSDRFLDHRTQNYPAERCGGNTDARYVDVEAIRILGSAPAGLQGALIEAWDRYATPLAITECHNACTREEQMRWTADAWQIARSLRGEGVDILAVTAWAAAGSRNWASLLTRDDGHYECGVFDGRAGKLRPTAMVPLLRELASDELPSHPAIGGKGWWRRDIRFAHRQVGRAAPVSAYDVVPRDTLGDAPLLIAGGPGTLGRTIASGCRHRGLKFVLTDHADLDVTSALSIDGALDRFRPWAVINATGCASDTDHGVGRCGDIDDIGMTLLANACRNAGIHYTDISGNPVFDEYGLTLTASAFVSLDNAHNDADAGRTGVLAGHSPKAAADYSALPTGVPDLIDRLLDLIIDGETGVRNLSNGGSTSDDAEMERAAITVAKHDRVAAAEDFFNAD
jgi:dTDP-4-dehydrorhamnose reductase